MQIYILCVTVLPLIRCLAAALGLPSILNRQQAITGEKYIFVGEDLRLTCSPPEATLATYSVHNISFSFSQPLQDSSSLDECLPMSWVHVDEVQQSASLVVLNATLKNDGQYTCHIGNKYCLGREDIGQLEYVDSDDVHVEYPPHNVSQFNCVFYNWNDFVNCTWQHPVKYADWSNINISAAYTVSLKNNEVHAYRCPHLTHNDCTFNSSEFFLANYYVIEVNVTNIPKSVTASKNFIVNANEAVKPAPVINLSANSTPGCITLSWEHSKKYQKEYRIRHQIVGVNNFEVVNDSITDTNSTLCGYHSYTHHNFSVDCKPANIYSGYWSDPVYINAWTPMTAPNVGPTTINGSYTTSKCVNGLRNVTLMWQDVEEKQRNGIISGYFIKHGEKYLKNVTSDNHLAVVELSCDSTSELTIFAYNKVGHSVKPSVLVISPINFADITVDGWLVFLNKGIDLIFRLYRWCSNLTEAAELFSPGEVTGEDMVHRPGEVKGKDMVHRPGEVTGKDMVHRPGEVKGKDMVHRPGEVTGKDMVHRPGEVKGKDMVHRPGEVTGKDTVHRPGEVTGEDMVHRPGEVTGKDMVHRPGEVKGKDMVHRPGEVTGKDTVHRPGEVTGKDMVHRPGEVKGKDMVHRPGEVTGEDMVHRPGEVTGKDMVHRPGEVKGKDMVHRPGEVTGKDTVHRPGEVTGKDMVHRPGEVKGKDTVHRPGEVTGKDTVLSPGEVTGKDVDHSASLSCDLGMSSPDPVSITPVVIAMDALFSLTFHGSYISTVASMSPCSLSVPESIAESFVVEISDNANSAHRESLRAVWNMTEDTKILSYIIFWCLGQPGSTCEGPINWSEVSGSQRSFDLPTLEAAAQKYLFGISKKDIQTGSASSIFWTGCLFRHSLTQDDVKTVKSLNVLENGTGYVRVGWSQLQCSYEYRVKVSNYRVKWCEVSHCNDTDGVLEETVPATSSWYKVSPLTANQEYKFTVQAVADGHAGEEYEPWVKGSPHLSASSNFGLIALVVIIIPVLFLFYLSRKCYYRYRHVQKVNKRSILVIHADHQLNDSPHRSPTTSDRLMPGVPASTAIQYQANTATVVMNPGETTSAEEATSAEATSGEEAMSANTAGDSYADSCCNSRSPLIKETTQNKTRKVSQCLPDAPDYVSYFDSGGGASELNGAASTLNVAASTLNGAASTLNGGASALECSSQESGDTGVYKGLPTKKDSSKVGRSSTSVTTGTESVDSYVQVTDVSAGQGDNHVQGGTGKQIHGKINAQADQVFLCLNQEARVAENHYSNVAVGDSNVYDEIIKPQSPDDAVINVEPTGSSILGAQSAGINLGNSGSGRPPSQVTSSDVSFELYMNSSSEQSNSAAERPSCGNGYISHQEV